MKGSSRKLAEYHQLETNVNR